MHFFYQFSHIDAFSPHKNLTNDCRISSSLLLTLLRHEIFFLNPCRRTCFVILVTSIWRLLCLSLRRLKLFNRYTTIRNCLLPLSEAKGGLPLASKHQTSHALILDEAKKESPKIDGLLKSLSDRLAGNSLFYEHGTDFNTLLYVYFGSELANELFFLWDSIKLTREYHLLP